MGRLREERGSVLVTAVLLMALMTGVGLAAYALVDQEQQASAQERIRDTSFNLAEQLLNAQVYVLSRDWPGSRGVSRGTTVAYPVRCSQDSPTDARNRCPNTGAVMARFGGPDLAVPAQWSTVVRDDNLPNPNYYDDASTLNAPCVTGGSGPCTHDANDNGKLWVRAQAVVRGKRRTLIGLVKVDTVTEELPKSVILAGKFGTTNNGNKTIVHTHGQPVQVRCTEPAQSSCLDYPPKQNQIDPEMVETGYSGGDAMSDEQINRLRDRAMAEGTYYNSCPPRPDGGVAGGVVVFVEGGTCAYGNEVAPCCFSPENPGVFIINTGTIAFTGNIVFNGLLYAPNRNNSTGWVVSNTGTSRINGAVAVDRQGGMLIGSSGNPDNMNFDANVFNSVVSYANAGIVQNTWREIPAAAGS